MSISSYAVADTNVIVSSFLSPHSRAAEALHLLRHQYRLLASPETVEELRDVFMRDKFSRIGRAKRELLLVSFINALEVFQPHETVQACRDSRDDKFLSLAVSGKASLILTGDDDLLTLHPFRGIEILKPADYLAR